MFLNSIIIHRSAPLARFYGERPSKLAYPVHAASLALELVALHLELLALDEVGLPLKWALDKLAHPLLLALEQVGLPLLLALARVLPYR